jgi:hypothetical protein
VAQRCETFDGNELIPQTVREPTRGIVVDAVDRTMKLLQTTERVPVIGAVVYVKLAPPMTATFSGHSFAQSPNNNKEGRSSSPPHRSRPSSSAVPPPKVVLLYCSSLRCREDTTAALVENVAATPTSPLHGGGGGGGISSSAINRIIGGGGGGAAVARDPVRVGSVYTRHNNNNNNNFTTSSGRASSPVEERIPYYLEGKCSSLISSTTPSLGKVPPQRDRSLQQTSSSRQRRGVAARPRSCPHPPTLQPSPTQRFRRPPPSPQRNRSQRYRRVRRSPMLPPFHLSFPSCP